VSPGENFNEQIRHRNDWLFLFGRKQSLDDRLNMVFVNLTIAAGLVEQAAGRGPISGRLCNLKQPQTQAEGLQVHSYIYDEMQPEIAAQVSIAVLPRFHTSVLN